MATTRLFHLIWILLILHIDSDDQEGADEGSFASQRVLGPFPSQVPEIQCASKKACKEESEEGVYSIPSPSAREQGEHQLESVTSLSQSEGHPANLDTENVAIFLML